MKVGIFCSCVNYPSIPPDYYQDKSKILGGEKPTTPFLEWISSNKLQWTKSIDPDTGEEVKSYFLYYYYNEYPSEDILYNKEFVLVETPSRNVTISGFSPGIHYFTVTGFDGGRESFHSNIVFKEVK